MDRYSCGQSNERKTVVSRESLLFAEALLGRRITVGSRPTREQMEFLADVSTEQKLPLRREELAAAEARRQRELLEWLLDVAPDAARRLEQRMRESGADEESDNGLSLSEHDLDLCEAQWDPSKHPRLGGPPNAGWFAGTGGVAGSASIPSATRIQNVDTSFDRIGVTGVKRVSALLQAPKGGKGPRRQPPRPGESFGVARHGDMPTPRPGHHSHHGVMTAWMKAHYANYNEREAPAILMPKANHFATYGVYLAWRAQVERRMGGKFNWRKIGEVEIRALSELMFDVGQVPYSVRRQYWIEFEKMKVALRKGPSPKRIGECRMGRRCDVWTGDRIQARYMTAPEDDRRFRLDPTKVPERFQPLIPYAEFWGIPDEPARVELVDNAPDEVRRNMQDVVAEYDGALTDWLMGMGQGPITLTGEYIAFVALIMAADYAALYD